MVVRHCLVARQTVTPRITSLMPGLTEPVVELGLAGHLVARTGFCIHPAAVVGRIPKGRWYQRREHRRITAARVFACAGRCRREPCRNGRRDACFAHAPQVVVTHPLEAVDNLSRVDDLLTHFGVLSGMAGRPAVLAGASRHELALTRLTGRGVCARISLQH